MNLGEVLRRIAVLSALVLFALAYGLLPAFAADAEAKAQKAKPAPSLQKSATGARNSADAVAVPGTPLDTPGGAAGVAPPERLPIPESQRPDMLDIPRGVDAQRPPIPRPTPPDKAEALGAIDPGRGQASSGHPVPTGPVPAGEASSAPVDPPGPIGPKGGAIDDPRAKTGIIGDMGTEAGVIGDIGTEAASPGGFGVPAPQAGTSAAEAEAGAAASSPPIPESGEQPPPRPPGPTEVPPGN